MRRRRIAAAVAASLALSAFAGPLAAQAAADEADPDAGRQRAALPKPAPGKPAPSRWAEDWTVNREADRRQDFVDRLKYIPLDSDGDVYLTLSGEFRLRYNQLEHPGLRDGPSQQQEIVRVFGGADLHVGDHFRVFTELAHAGLSGSNPGPRPPTLENDLFLQQAFVDFTGEAAPGGRDADFGIRLGRQEFVEGPPTLIALRDNNTVRFTLDGVRAWAETDTTRVTLFDLFYQRLGTGGIDDDRTNRDVRFSGVSTRFGLPTDLMGGSKLYFDPFAWRLRNRAAQWGGTTGLEEREFYGMRLWGNVGRVGVDLTVNRQDGTFDGRPIGAWHVFSEQTLGLGDGPAAPRIGLRADYASGGGAFGNGTLRNATTPYGTNIRLSHTLTQTATNIKTLAPTFSFRPFGKARMTLEYQFAWRDSLNDGVYRANGTMFPGTEAVQGRKIGEMARVQLVWPLAPRLTFTGRYEHLDAGPALTEAGYRSSDYIAAYLSYRF